jgi:hypothetical protein
VKRVLRWVLWYLSIGVAVGISTGSHQARRFDPGFDPLFTAVVTIFVWPVTLSWDLQSLLAHYAGSPRR